MTIKNTNTGNSHLIEDCRQLIENIILESQPEHKYILAIVAKADHQGIIHPEPNSLFPNFYGYTMDRTKMYLMTDLHITSNVPRSGEEMKIMTGSDLVLSEKKLNIHYRNKTIDDLLFEQAKNTWAWTKNTSPYQNAEVILVFRDKAIEFLKSQKERQDSTDIDPVKNDYEDIPVKIVISDLQSKYQEIEHETNKVQFFIKIAQYGQYILENKATIEILNPLYQESKNDCVAYKKAWKEFVNLWKSYATDILKIAEKAGIEDRDPLSNEISSIKSKLETETIALWESDIDNFYTPYMKLIWKFKDEGKLDLLIPKHVEPQNKNIVIHSQYRVATDEWDKFKYSREAKVWWAHYQICRAAAGVLGLAISKDYFQKNRVIDMFYKFEFDEVARGNINRSPIVLHQEKFAVWIERLHKYLIPRLENYDKNNHQPIQIDNQTLKHESSEQPNDWDNKYNWITDKQFYLDENKIITFTSNNSDRYKVFKMLTDAKGQFVTVNKIAKTLFTKNDSTTHHKVRVILGQLDKEKCAKHKIIKIVSLETGSYRIGKFLESLPKTL